MKCPVVRFVPDSGPASILTIKAPYRPHVTRAVSGALSRANVLVLTADQRPDGHLLRQRIRLCERDGAPLAEKRKAAVRDAVAHAIEREMPARRTLRPLDRWDARDAIEEPELVWVRDLPEVHVLRRRPAA